MSYQPLHAPSENGVEAHDFSAPDDDPIARSATATSLTYLNPSKSHAHARKMNHNRRLSSHSYLSSASAQFLHAPPWSPHVTHTLISIAAGTVMCLFGYEQGVFGGIIIGRNFIDYFDDPSPGMTGFVTSVYDLGCFAGAVGTLFIGERLGRKRMLIFGTIVMASGILVQTGATKMSHLLWGRFVAGIGNGGNTATAPVWHVETASLEEKGKAVVKEMVVNVLGFVVSNVITLACSRISTEAQWRFPLGIQIVYIVIILVLVPLLPESPRWLCARGRDDEARAVLEILSDDEVEIELAEIKASVKKEQAAQVGWKDMFKPGTSRRRLLLGMGLQCAQQLTGINVLCYYLPLVLTKSVGLTDLLARLLSTANAIVFMSATACSLFFIERYGRRPLLMSAALGQALAFTGIAIATEVGHGDAKQHIPGIIATVFISLYFIAFALGWVATPWLYPAEINSLSMRTKGAALATACDWLFNYVVVQTTPLGIHYLHWGLYLIYALLNLSFVPLVYFFIVETAGKSLEQIDRWFASSPGWFVNAKSQDAAYAAVSGHGQIDGQEEEEDRVALMKGTGGFAGSVHGSLEQARRSSVGDELWKLESNEDDDLDDDAVVYEEEEDER